MKMIDFSFFSVPNFCTGFYGKSRVQNHKSLQLHLGLVFHINKSSKNSSSRSIEKAKSISGLCQFYQKLKLPTNQAS